MKHVAHIQIFVQDAAYLVEVLVPLPCACHRAIALLDFGFHRMIPAFETYCAGVSRESFHDTASIGDGAHDETKPGRDVTCDIDVIADVFPFASRTIAPRSFVCRLERAHDFRKWHGP